MRTKAILIILGSLILTSCSVLLDSYKSEIDGVYIPKNLDDAISEVNGFYPDSLKREVRKLSEDAFIGLYHMETGLYMRNNWGLWSSSRLSRYFKRKGIKHPDDMSGIVLTSFYRKLNGKNIDFKNQIEESKAYWKELKKIGKLVQLPKPSEHPADSLEFGYAMWYNTNKKNSLVHLQTNSKTDSLYIYDYLYGWKKIGSEVETQLKNQNKYKTDSLLNVIYREGAFRYDFPNAKN